MRSLEQRGHYMVSQAFRKPKVLWARAFTMQTRERARDGRDRPQATGCVTGVRFPVLSATTLPFYRGACQEPLLAKTKEKEQLSSMQQGGLQTEGSHSRPGSVRMAFFSQ